MIVPARDHTTRSVLANDEKEILVVNCNLKDKTVDSLY